MAYRSAAPQVTLVAVARFLSCSPSQSGDPGRGRYENASEVVRAALRTLEREEQQYEAKLAALRAAIDEGDASGVAKGNVFTRVRRTLNLPAHSR